MAWAVGVLVVKFLHRQKCEIEPVSTAEIKSLKQVNGRQGQSQQCRSIANLRALAEHCTEDVERWWGSRHCPPHEAA